MVTSSDHADDSGMSQEYPHLLKITAQMLTQPLDERIKFVCTDKFIPTPDASEALVAMMEMLRAPSVLRQEGIAIVGHTGAGKSALVSEFLKFAGKDPVCAGRAAPLPEMTLQSGVNEQRFNLSFARAMKVPGLENSKSTGLQTHQIYNQIDLSRPRCVTIQEANNFTTTTKMLQTQVCACIKNIMHDKRVMFVLSGTPEYLPIIEEEKNRQLGNRLMVFRLGPIRDMQDLANFLFTLESYLPFPKPSQLASPKNLELFDKHSDGWVGKIIRIARHAAIRALSAGEENVSGARLLAAARLRYGGELGDSDARPPRLD